MLKFVAAIFVPAILLCENTVRRLLLADSRRARRVALLLLGAAAAGTVIMLFWTGCSHQWFGAWDGAYVLDGAWRMYNGQRPHADFFTVLGPIPFLVVVLGMGLAGPSVDALAYGYALLFPLFTLWAWLLAKRRLPAFAALLVALLVGYLLVGTRVLGTIGTTWRSTSYAMAYNRLGWALLSLLILQVFLEPREGQSRRTALLEGASSGIILALLLFTKINYFGTGAAAAILGVVLFREVRRTWASLVAAFAVVTVATALCLRFDVTAFLRDLRLIVGAGSSYGRPRAMWSVASMNMDSAALLLVLVALTTRPLYDRATRRLSAGWGRLLVAAAVTAGMGLAVCSTNAQDKDIPLFALAALAVCEGFRRRCLRADAPEKNGADAKLRYLLGSVVAVYLAGRILVPDAGSVAYSFAWKLHKAGRMPDAARIHTDTMKAMLLPPTEDEVNLDHDAVVKAILEDRMVFTSYRYAAWVNDGLELLRPRVSPTTRMFVMDWYNPFSFALKLPPPRGDTIGWLADISFTEDSHLAPERVFHEVTHVMVPKRPMLRRTMELMQQIYGPTVEAEFEKVAESKLWELYIRRAGTAQHGAD